ncbi:hypothetical protein Dsin_028352 [Dipteronia sinensis]|uniref:Uncharacterized protein n=1 Tax=Dipteronia sinensis TaxID=43782 RepID=A0AAD9ZRW0_9ROSI|nr:hypothetical protein Dsin_028352 [Dipteronia sinensis]
MIGFSWNVRGLGNPRAFAALRRQVINDCDLTDTGCFGHRLTWNNIRYGKWSNDFGRELQKETYSVCYKITRLDEAGLALVIQDYFSTIFQSSNPSIHNTMTATEGIKSNLSVDKREQLCAVFTPVEVRIAVFDMTSTKTPDLDGFHAIFFQKLWGVLAEEFFRVCLWA